MKHVLKLSLAAFFAAMILSCATTNKPPEFSPFRLASFAVFDSEETLIQQVDITYSEADKPASIVMTDSEGNEVGLRLISYSETGKVSSIENSGAYTAYSLSRYNYDESDYLVSIVTSDKEGKVLNRADYTNDSRGNPVEWISSTGRASQDIHFLVEYDDKDRVVKTTEVDPSGEPIYYSISEYDEEGNELSYTIYSPEGLIDQQLINTYAEGFLVQSDILDEKGTVLYSTVYELNDRGQPVLISNYNQYGDRSDYTEVLYDEQGNERERAVYNYENDLTEKTVKEYDEQGNNISLIISGPDGTIYSATRNSFEEKPLAMAEEEFNSLVFRLR
ncbi:hypothetical protein [Spirochaeta isovalerica]|uniref:Antitoxin component YwqK of YwqJK toxin-antitoxin module n=1 Tax=Spirochaeta isovalerica TaxID=150 RepID=A0A841RGM0_9SPIO|nr:hypothetical protein [Spirochaeta isovalerica]MBB6481929.1 antitoxin component YwqK of YwqJK toxin-antitoxin module [Spirochaeta isovalerica]